MLTFYAKCKVTQISTSSTRGFIKDREFFTGFHFLCKSQQKESKHKTRGKVKPSKYESIKNV